MNLLHSLSKRPNLDLKSWPKLLLSSLPLSGIYTGEKTLHVVAIASGGDLKLHRSVKSLDPHGVCE
jgi:hypothetical protein